MNHAPMTRSIETENGETFDCDERDDYEREPDDLGTFLRDSVSTDSTTTANSVDPQPPPPVNGEAANAAGEQAKPAKRKRKSKRYTQRATVGATKQPDKPIKDGLFGSYNAFIDYYQRTLSSGAQSTFSTLWRSENRKRHRVSIGQEELAEKRGVCLKTIQRDTDELEKKGFMVTVKQGHSGVNSMYELHPVPLYGGE